MAKRRFYRLAVGAAALATLSAGLLLTGGSAAFASGGGGPIPPWESSISPAPNGFIEFYNSHGQVVTGGSIGANGLGAYAVASTAAPDGYTKATLIMKTPVKGELPALWSGEQISSSTTFPNASAPAPVGTTTHPVETNPGTDTPISQYISAFPNSSTASGYEGLYDVRMIVSGPGIPPSATYWDTVISVNENTGTWSVDYPDWTQKTTTTLTASPPSPQQSPVPVTLTATVAPAAAGTVSFWSGKTQIGETQTVTSGNGVATVNTTPPKGTTPYQAFFTPASASTTPYDIGSASATLKYQVGAVPPTLGTPVLTGSGKVGSTETCTATVSGATTVTYAWQSNGKAISGATKSTFTVPASLNGKTLTCSVTASNSGGTVTHTSKGVKIALPSLVLVTKPVVSGPHVPGKAEKVTAGKWKPSASKVTYQWYVGSTKEKGATKSSFTVPKSAKGKTVHCVETASKSGYANATYSTKPVKIT